MGTRLSGAVIAASVGILLASSIHAADLKLTIVYDNNPYENGLDVRWGFSCLVEGLEKTILFDVGGEGAILLGNMEKLQIDPEIIDVLVLSHVHYDHIGGLTDFLGRNPDVVVYAPQSFPGGVKREIRDAGADLVEVGKALQICRHAFSTGELGGGIKEQSLIIETPEGAVVITGCAHPGIVLIVQKAKGMLKSPVYLVAGGFHMSGMESQRIGRIICELQREEVMKVAPCHCTGDLARQRFEEVYGQDFLAAGAGRVIVIADAL